MVECQVGIICGKSSQPKHDRLLTIQANMPAIYQLIKIWKPKLVSGTSRGTKETRSKSRGTAPTPEIKGSIVNGKFSGTPIIRTLTHERSDSTELLSWSKDVDGNTIELAPTSKRSLTPPMGPVPPGQAF